MYTCRRQNSKLSSQCTPKQEEPVPPEDSFALKIFFNCTDEESKFWSHAGEFRKHWTLKWTIRYDAVNERLLVSFTLQPYFRISSIDLFDWSSAQKQVFSYICELRKIVIVKHPKQKLLLAPVIESCRSVSLPSIPSNGVMQKGYWDVMPTSEQQ